MAWIVSLQNLLLFFLFYLNLSAQSSVDNERNLFSHGIDISLLGYASFGSLNYETRAHFGKLTLSTRIGIGYNEDYCILGCNDKGRYLVVPHHFTVYYGKKQHYIETGIGGSIFYGGAASSYIVYPVVGYRLLPRTFPKYVFRIYAHYIHPWPDVTDILFIPVGISFGVNL